MADLKLFYWGENGESACSLIQSSKLTEDPDAVLNVNEVVSEARKFMNWAQREEEEFEVINIHGQVFKLDSNPPLLKLLSNISKTGWVCSIAAVGSKHPKIEIEDSHHAHINVFYKTGQYSYRGDRPMSYAIGELVDNSVQATRSNDGPREIDILVRLKEEPTSKNFIAVRDNGRGMDATAIHDLATLAKTLGNSAGESPSVRGHGKQFASASSRLSRHGVGLKHACSYLGSRFRVISSPQENPQWVYEKVMDQEQANERSARGEDPWVVESVSRKRGDVEHLLKEYTHPKAQDIIKLEALDENQHCPFTLVLITNVRGECLDMWDKDLDQLELEKMYAFYLKPELQNSFAQADSHQGEDSRRSAPITIHLNGESLGEEKKDIISRFEKAKHLQFEFTLHWVTRIDQIEETHDVRVVLLYFPYADSGAEDESKKWVEDQRVYPYWDYRYIPLKVDSLFFLPAAHRVEKAGLDVKCLGRIRVLLFFPNSLEVTQDKQSFRNEALLAEMLKTGQANNVAVKTTPRDVIKGRGKGNFVIEKMKQWHKHDEELIPGARYDAPPELLKRIRELTKAKDKSNDNADFDIYVSAQKITNQATLDLRTGRHFVLGSASTSPKDIRTFMALTCRNDQVGLTYALTFPYVVYYDYKVYDEDDAHEFWEMTNDLGEDERHIGPFLARLAHMDALEAIPVDRLSEYAKNEQLKALVDHPSRPHKLEWQEPSELPKKMKAGESIAQVGVMLLDRKGNPVVIDKANSLSSQHSPFKLKVIMEIEQEGHKVVEVGTCKVPISRIFNFKNVVINRTGLMTLRVSLLDLYGKAIDPLEHALEVVTSPACAYSIEWDKKGDQELRLGDVAHLRVNARDGLANDLGGKELLELMPSLQLRLCDVSAHYAELKPEKAQIKDDGRVVVPLRIVGRQHASPEQRLPLKAAKLIVGLGSSDAPVSQVRLDAAYRPMGESTTLVFALHPGLATSGLVTFDGNAKPRWVNLAPVANVQVLLHDKWNNRVMDKSRYEVLLQSNILCSAFQNAVTKSPFKKRLLNVPLKGDGVYGIGKLHVWCPERQRAGGDIPEVLVKVSDRKLRKKGGGGERVKALALSIPVEVSVEPFRGPFQSIWRPPSPLPPGVQVVESATTSVRVIAPAGQTLEGWSLDLVDESGVVLPSHEAGKLKFLSLSWDSQKDVSFDPTVDLLPPITVSPAVGVTSKEWLEVEIPDQPISIQHVLSMSIVSIGGAPKKWRFIQGKEDANEQYVVKCGEPTAIKFGVVDDRGNLTAFPPHSRVKPVVELVEPMSGEVKLSPDRWAPVVAGAGHQTLFKIPPNVHLVGPCGPVRLRCRDEEQALEAANLQCLLEAGAPAKLEIGTERLVRLAPTILEEEEDDEDEDDSRATKAPRISGSVQPSPGFRSSPPVEGVHSDPLESIFSCHTDDIVDDLKVFARDASGNPILDIPPSFTCTMTIGEGLGPADNSAPITLMRRSDYFEVPQFEVNAPRQLRNLCQTSLDQELLHPKAHLKLEARSDGKTIRQVVRVKLRASQAVVNVSLIDPIALEFPSVVAGQPMPEVWAQFEQEDHQAAPKVMTLHDRHDPVIQAHIVPLEGSASDAAPTIFTAQAVPEHSEYTCVWPAGAWSAPAVAGQYGIALRYIDKRREMSLQKRLQHLDYTYVEVLHVEPDVPHRLAVCDEHGRVTPDVPSPLILVNTDLQRDDVNLLEKNTSFALVDSQDNVVQKDIDDFHPSARIEKLPDNPNKIPTVGRVEMYFENGIIKLRRPVRLVRQPAEGISGTYQLVIGSTEVRHRGFEFRREVHITDNIEAQKEINKLNQLIKLKKEEMAKARAEMATTKELLDDATSKKRANMEALKDKIAEIQKHHSFRDVIKLKAGCDLSVATVALEACQNAGYLISRLSSQPESRPQWGDAQTLMNECVARLRSHSPGVFYEVGFNIARVQNPRLSVMLAHLAADAASIFTDTRDNENRGQDHLRHLGYRVIPQFWPEDQIDQNNAYQLHPNNPDVLVFRTGRYQPPPPNTYQGFLGYAVNLISLKPEHRQYRKSYFASLFRNAVVFTQKRDAEDYRDLCRGKRVMPPMIYICDERNHRYSIRKPNGVSVTVDAENPRLRRFGSSSFEQTAEGKSKKDIHSKLQELQELHRTVQETGHHHAVMLARHRSSDDQGQKKLDIMEEYLDEYRHKLSQLTHRHAPHAASPGHSGHALAARKSIGTAPSHRASRSRSGGGSSSSYGHSNRHGKRPRR